MRKTATFLAILLAATMVPVQATAGYNLKVTYKVPLDFDEDETYGGSFITESVRTGTSEANSLKKNVANLVKSSSGKAKMLYACKQLDGYNGRLKVTSATGATAGLSYLKNVTTSGVEVMTEYASLPDYTDDELYDLESTYDYEEDYPDYIEDGYVYYYVTGNCNFTGTVSLISSNAYKIYIDGASGPEYSKSELASMKWAIVLVDN